MITSTLAVLIVVHLILGGFDTLYHHEFKERLAWRPSQRKEVKLHGIRNLFYAVIYFCFGILNPSGIFAVIFIAILLIEVGITLVDFVEEDKSRKLPVTERILHTVLALSFGAILVLLVPRLWSNKALESALNFQWLGAWSFLCCIAAVAAVFFAARDFHAAKRLSRIADKKPAMLIAPASPEKHYLITGGTGFIGSKLVRTLSDAGYKITVLTRHEKNGEHLPKAVTLITSLDDISNDHKIDIVINLAGATTAKYWSAKHKEKMITSRIDTTRGLVALIGRLRHKPELLISGSAIGAYGISTDGQVDEDDSAKDESFSQQLCLTWEAEALRAANIGIRVVLLRTGMVLDIEDGPMSAMLIPTEFGGGAILGDGKQIMSWITRDDIIRAIAHIVATESIAGPVNAVSPAAVPNAEFTRTLASALSRPTLVKFPKRVLAMLAGGFASEILLASQHVEPTKLLNSGFVFSDDTLKNALNNMLAIEPTR